MEPAGLAWVLISSALVLFMTPGLAFFYGGMDRRRNVLNMLMMNFYCVLAVPVLWMVLAQVVMQLVHAVDLAHERHVSAQEAGQQDRGLDADVGGGPPWEHHDDLQGSWDVDDLTGAASYERSTDIFIDA
ncbi:MAG: ammonium transporter [Oxalobacteraceae bacterium]|nr:ammonium transporter [Oxalobacteraceae bacterium]